MVLTGKEISLLAQIVSVVDVYDALTTNRPYRRALPSDAAYEIRAGTCNRVGVPPGPGGDVHPASRGQRQRLPSEPRKRGVAHCGQLEQNDVEPIVQVGTKLTTLNNSANFLVVVETT